MKLILKTLKQIPHEVEVANDEVTIKELKQEAESKHNIAYETIKLVFNGVVLKDENSIKSYNITEGNVIVMMISKTKIQNKPKVEETVIPDKKDIGNTQITNNNNSQIPSNTTSTVGIGNTGVSNIENNNYQNNSNTNNTTSTIPSPDYTEAISTLVEMGFPKEYSETAIKAAQGNVSLAIEFLYNGIPENLTNVNPSSSVGSVGTGNGNSTQAVPNNQSSQPTSSLDAVKRIASMVKVLCQNDPSQLQNIIMSLQQTRPELIELIKQHEAEFKNIIQSPVSEEDYTNFNQINAEFRGQGSSTGQGQQEQGQGTIRLSKPEFDAIQRLKEFGFSEMDAAQAYFACDKNEEMALNFLFEMKTQEGNFDGKWYIHFIYILLLFYYKDNLENFPQINNNTGNQGYQGSLNNNNTQNNNNNNNQEADKQDDKKDEKKEEGGSNEGEKKD